jgi:DNA/RNA-binding domain of Phe-tRNA-synthetase-like protein
MPTIFQYHPDVIASYPNIVGGVILAEDVINGPTPAGLLEGYTEEQAAVLEKIGDTPLSEIASLNAWRRAFRAFGANPTKYRSASEALLRRLTKKGDIPSIIGLVDLANMVSIRYALPVAAFNTQEVQGPITVHFSDGTEWFKPLGRGEPEHPSEGEAIFSDEKQMVVARRWCWRQSAESAAGPDTTRAIFTVEAQHPAGRGAVEEAIDDLLGLLPEYFGGSYQSAVLDVNHPVFSAA